MLRLRSEQLHGQVVMVLDWFLGGEAARLEVESDPDEPCEIAAAEAESAEAFLGRVRARAVAEARATFSRGAFAPVRSPESAGACFLAEMAVSQAVGMAGWWRALVLLSDALGVDLGSTNVEGDGDGEETQGREEGGTLDERLDREVDAWLGKGQGT